MNVNDGSSSPPKLKIFINEGNLRDLPPHSIWHKKENKTLEEGLSEDGFCGIQWNHRNPVQSSMPFCGLNRINTVDEVRDKLRFHKDRGDLAVTLHVAWGMETDENMDALARSIFETAAELSLPTFIETHRATMTQDIWRTVKLIERNPWIRLNADLSHYYCGHEMVYGDFQAKLDFMEPIFQRVGFMHGRIAAAGFAQAPIESLQQRPRAALGAADYLEHFREMWTRSMKGFQSTAKPGDCLVFAPELLPADLYYARKFPDAEGQMIEETDRYEQALLLAELAKQCWDSAGGCNLSTAG